MATPSSDVCMTPCDTPLSSPVASEKKRKEPQDEEAITKQPSGSEEPSPEAATPRKKLKLDVNANENGPAPIAELRSGKVHFQEKKLNLQGQPSTITELGSFFSYNSEQIEPSSTFPLQFKGLLAKLVEESEYDLPRLSKWIRKQLYPSTIEDGDAEAGDNSLPDSVIRDAIGDIAQRRNYGLQDDKVAPANLAIWRWEVRDMALFPPEMADIIKARRAKREQAAAILKYAHDSLAPEERSALFTAKRGSKGKLSSHNSAVQDSSTSTKEAKDKEREQKAAEQAAEKERKAAEKALEKERKAAEKAAEKERKAAERKAEKERKDAEKRAIQEAEELKKAQSQKSLNGFFTPIKKEAKKEIVEELPERNDLCDRFLPFHVKENTELAPTNRFHRDVPDSVVDTLFKNELRTEDLLEEYKREAKQSRRNRQIQRSTRSQEGPTDMEVDEDPVVAKLRKEKWKLLQFGGEIRPPYWGTFSKRSVHISGRRPLGHDPSLDYEVDSADEWEEDEPGEELKSEDEEEEEDDGDAPEEEEKDWLVPHGYLSDDEGEEKDDEEVRGGGQELDVTKRRLIEPLIPVMIGLVSDAEVADSSHPLHEYRIVPLSNAPVDPFEVVAAPSETATPKRKIASSRKAIFPDELLSLLISQINGSTASISTLVENLREKFPNVKKTAIEAKIRELAVREKRNPETKARWHLKSDGAAGGGASKSPPKSRASTPAANTPDRNSIVAFLKSPPPATQQGKSVEATEKSKPPEHPLLEKLRESASSKPNECLALMTDDEVGTLANSPDSLLAKLVEIAAEPAVRHDLRSRCFRLLGNYVHYVETKMRISVRDERDGYRRRWISLVDLPGLMEGIERSLREERSKASSGTIKNALRLLWFLAQCLDEVCAAFVAKLTSHIGECMLPLLLDILSTPTAAEEAGYCSALLHSTIHAFEGDEEQWKGFVAILRGLLTKVEMHEFDDKPSKDKWTGVKKYCLKMLGKIAARAKMPAQVCGEVQADVLRLFGGDTVEAVLREAAQECLVALKKVEETAKW